MNAEGPPVCVAAQFYNLDLRAPLLKKLEVTDPLLELDWSALNFRSLKELTLVEVGGGLGFSGGTAEMFLGKVKRSKELRVLRLSSSSVDMGRLERLLAAVPRLEVLDLNFVPRCLQRCEFLPLRRATVLGTLILVFKVQLVASLSENQIIGRIGPKTIWFVRCSSDLSSFSNLYSRCPQETYSKLLQRFKSTLHSVSLRPVSSAPISTSRAPHDDDVLRMITQLPRLREIKFLTGESQFQRWIRKSHGNWEIFEDGGGGR